MAREPKGEDIEFRDAQPGQCLWREVPELTVWRGVKVVDCAGDQWQVKLLNRFTIDAASAFPGDAGFLEHARARCATGWTEFLAPSELDWADGNRTVVCLEHRDKSRAPT
jgi:hypothetical protein